MAATEPTLTIREALALPVLRRGLPEVIAGADALDRPVTWVHVVEVVEVPGFMRSGEMILSTGLGSGEDPENQRAYVRSLANEDVGALVVELGRTYQGELPAAMVDEAVRQSLPLVALHRPVRFVEVTHVMTTALLSTELAALRHADGVLAGLLDSLQRGEGIDGVLGNVARTVRNPVVLEDAGGQLVRHDLHDSTDDAVLAAWTDFSSADARGETPSGVVAVGVRVGGRTWGRLIALELDGSLHELDRVTLERAAVALGVTLRDVRPDSLRSGGGAVLGELRQGRLAPGDAHRRAMAAGFPRRTASLLPIAASWRGLAWSGVASSPEAAWDALASELRKSLIDLGSAALVGSQDAELLGVVTQADPDIESAGDVDDGTTRDRIAKVINNVLSRRGLSETDIALALGPAVAEWGTLGDALDRTARGAAAALREAPRPWYDARRTTMVDLLFTMRDGPQLRAFVRDHLGPLLDGEDIRSRDLLRTLESYYANGTGKAATARALHLERQSLYNRLQRIEELLEVSLEDADATLEIGVALRAARFLEFLD